jgi:acyl-coenzyme A synthetase/AMP-(fatty) acid ligase
MGIHHQLLAAAERRADATAWWWVERDRALTFDGAVAQVDRMAGALADLGAGPGAPVGIHAHSGLDFVVALFGAWRLGAAAVTIDVRSPDLRTALAATRPAVLVYTHDRYDEVIACRELVGELVCMDGPQEGAHALADVLAAASAPDGPPADDPSAPALVTTSGAATVGALLDAAVVAAASLGWTPHDIALGASPLWELDHAAASLLPALASAAPAAVSSNWTAEAGWDAAERTAASILSVTPEQADGFLAECTARTKAPLGLRAIQVVGAAVPAGLGDAAAPFGLGVVAGPAVAAGPTS